MNYNYTHTVGGQRPSISRRLTGWLLAIIGFAALAMTAQAQTATVTGRVMNQATGEYLKYATVQVVGSEKSTITEDGGVYTLTNLPPGEVKLSASYTGLDVQDVTVVVPATGSVQQDISMTSSSLGEVIKLGEFKVASAREGNSKAIVQQRVAMNLKTIVAADAFGDVAEGNVGEFLKLLPGVSVDYVDNDVRSTRIRGLPPKYTTTTLDGLPIANSGSNNLSATGQGRYTELEQLSMAALDVVETTKTPTPDMMGLNLAGNVNAISKSAFNQKGRSIKYQGSTNFNQWYGSFGKSPGWDNQEHSKAMFGGKFEWVDTFLDGKLGMVFSAAHSGAFADQRVTIGTQVWDMNPNNNVVEMPLISTWNFQDGLKPTWRDSLLLNLDYKVSDDLKLSLHTNYGYYRSEFYNRNWLVNANTTGLNTYSAYNAADDSTGTLQDTPTAQGIINRSGTSATSLGTATNSYARVLGSNQRKSGGTFNISPVASWKHDNIKVDVLGMYSIGKTAYTSGQDGFFSLVQADMQKVSWKYDRLGADNVQISQLSTGSGATLSNQGSVFDLGNYNTGGSVEQTSRNSKAQTWSGKVDTEIAYPDWKIPTTFKVGLSESLEVRDVHTLQMKWTMTLTTGAQTATAINLQNYRDPYGSKVGTVTDINGRTARAPAADKWALYNLFQSYGNTDPYSTVANGPFAAQWQNNLRNKLQNDVDIKETIQAAYAMATVKPVRKLSVVAGLRFERTESQGKGYDDQGIDNTLTALGVDITTLTAGTTGIAGSKAAKNATLTNTAGYIYYRYGSRVMRDKSYSNALPVVQARYELSKKFIVRAAYYKSLLRPDFQNVVGGLNAVDNNDGTYAFSVNNTRLKPETANNGDISVEYYFEPVGLLSASVFYKDITNIQISTPKATLGSAPQDIQDQIREAGYSSAVFNDGNSTFTSTINGPKTSMWGYELAYSQELSFLPSVLNGLGVTVNYSHYEPKEKRLWALVPNAGDGMAMNQGNFILRYKAGKFKAQVAATWTDKRLTGNSLSGMTLNPDGSFTPITNAVNANVTNYQMQRWVISPSGEYQLSRYATLFASVNNIFNSAKTNYAERTAFTTRNGNYGASITLGVKGSF